MLDHHLFLVPRLAQDSEEAEAINGMVAGLWFDKEALNQMLAEAERDQIVCFVTTLCGEVNAGFTVIENGRVTTRCIERYPLLSHEAALGEALRMAQEYQHIES